MTAGTLLIDGVFPLDPGCCPNEVYALLFNQQKQAIKPTLGVYAFAAFVLVDIDDFAIILSEDAEWTKYYSEEITPANVNIAATPDGECYYLEFWKRDNTSGFSREDDTLLEVRPVYWTGNQLSRTKLSDADVSALALWQTQIHYSYDSETSEVRFIAWLEKNGQIVTDTQQVEVTWTKRDEDPIFSTVQNTPMVECPGVFTWVAPTISLDPDEVSPMKVIFTDADDNLHTGYSASITWD